MAEVTVISTSENDFDFNARNMELIQELMEIMGVADCEKLAQAIRNLKRDAAEHCVEQAETGVPLPEYDPNYEEPSAFDWSCVFCGTMNREHHSFCHNCEAER